MNYDKLPESLRQSAELYICNGLEPGSFLSACFRNDLVGTYAFADIHNKKLIPQIVDWLYNDCPMSVRGEENFKEWVKARGQDVQA